MKWHRNSIGIEIDRDYCRLVARRLMQENNDLFSEAEVQFLKEIRGGVSEPQVCEDASLYGIKRTGRGSKVGTGPPGVEIA